MNDKEKFEIIGKIIERADKMGLLMFDRLTLLMDIDNVNEKIPLSLEEMLNADNHNFTHDIMGIQNNFNRRRMKLENCFLPRFADTEKLEKRSG